MPEERSRCKWDPFDIQMCSIYSIRLYEQSPEKHDHIAIGGGTKLHSTIEGIYI